MQPSTSVTLALIFAQATFGQSAEKPSPVPSRVRKQEHARALEQPSLSASNQMAANWTPEPGNHTPPRPAAPVHWDGPQTGTSVYFSSNVSGKASASGEILNPEEMTAGHASLPFGTMLKVTNIKNGKEVTLRVVDRISASSRHILSVSEKAATELDFRRAGIGTVQIIPVQPVQNP